MNNPIIQVKEEFAGKIMNFEEHSTRRIYIEIAPQDIADVARFLFTELAFRFATASAIDTPKGIEILYHFSHDNSGKMLTIRTLIKDKKDPHIESITPIIKAAEWIEREMWEMLGIQFDHHPNLKKLLLAEDWPEGEFPLRHED